MTEPTYYVERSAYEDVCKKIISARLEIKALIAERDHARVELTNARLNSKALTTESNKLSNAQLEIQALTAERDHARDEYIKAVCKHADTDDALKKLIRSVVDMMSNHYDEVARDHVKSTFGEEFYEHVEYVKRIAAKHGPRPKFDDIEFINEEIVAATAELSDASTEREFARQIAHVENTAARDVSDIECDMAEMKRDDVRSKHESIMKAANAKVRAANDRVIDLIAKRDALTKKKPTTSDAKVLVVTSDE